MFKEIHLKRIWLSLAIAQAALLLLNAGACWANPSAGQVKTAISKGNVLTPDSSFAVHIVGNKVAIATRRHANATDDDCKIDAALIAKQVMDLCPNNPPSVEVSFQDMADSNQLAKVTVTAFDIKGYGTGKLSKGDLLKAIVLTPIFKVNPLKQFADQSYDQFLASNWVAPGELQVERQDLFAHIKNMQAKGLSKDLADSDFTELFRIEDLLRTSQNDSAHKCFAALQDTVKSQESRLN